MEGQGKQDCPARQPRGKEAGAVFTVQRSLFIGHIGPISSTDRTLLAPGND
jgi:hypothetical protein